MATDPMIGKKYHRLTVIEFAGRSKHRAMLYKCECECGEMSIAQRPHLKNGHTKSCGCLSREGGRKVHGHSVAGKITRTYSTWLNMNGRCNNPKARGYSRYGGRGITICERWKKFENFLADMGERPDSMTIDRIKGDKGYLPENCKWSTKKEQNRNMSTNKLLLFKGKTKCLAEWSEIMGVNVSTLRERIKRGWSVEKALTKKTKKAYI